MDNSFSDENQVKNAKQDPLDKSSLDNISVSPRVTLKRRQQRDLIFIKEPAKQSNINAQLNLLPLKIARRDSPTQDLLSQTNKKVKTEPLETSQAISLTDPTEGGSSPAASMNSSVLSSGEILHPSEMSASDATQSSLNCTELNADSGKCEVSKTDGFEEEQRESSAPEVIENKSQESVRSDLTSQSQVDASSITTQIPTSSESADLFELTVKDEFILKQSAIQLSRSPSNGCCSSQAEQSSMIETPKKSVLTSTQHSDEVSPLKDEQTMATPIQKNIEMDRDVLLANKEGARGKGSGNDIGLSKGQLESEPKSEPQAMAQYPSSFNTSSSNLSHEVSADNTSIPEVLQSQEPGEEKSSEISQRLGLSLPLADRQKSCKLKSPEIAAQVEGITMTACSMLTPKTMTQLCTVDLAASMKNTDEQVQFNIKSENVINQPDLEKNVNPLTEEKVLHGDSKQLAPSNCKAPKTLPSPLRMSLASFFADDIDAELERRKSELSGMKKKCSQLTSSEAQLQAQVRSLRNEIGKLRQQLQSTDLASKNFEKAAKDIQTEAQHKIATLETELAQVKSLVNSSAAKEAQYRKEAERATIGMNEAEARAALSDNKLEKAKNLLSKRESALLGIVAALESQFDLDDNNSQTDQFCNRDTILSLAADATEMNDLSL